MEHSILERNNSSRTSLHSGICFGRISKVFSDSRTCEVKTFMGHGRMEDNHIPNCQWINGDAHPDGDESGVVPREGALGLVFYIDGEPFIFGFWKPRDNAGSAATGTDLEALNDGDRILKTIGLNKIILRAHGEIQIVSTDTCQITLFPDSNILHSLCRNYEFITDGGTINWTNLNDNDDTLYQQEYRNNISRDNVIIEARGKIDDNGTISRTTIGAGTDNGIDAPVYSVTTKITGETELLICAPGATVGHKVTILPDGTTTLEVGGNSTLTFKPDGTVSLNTSGQVSVQASSIQLNGNDGQVLTTMTDSVIDEVFGTPTTGVSTVTAG